MLGAVALTGKSYSRKLALDSSTLAEIRGKYSDIEPWWRDTFGYGFEGLTQSEARTLLTFDKGRLSPDAIRDRILAAGHEGLFRMGQAATGHRPGTEASVDPDDTRYSVRPPKAFSALPDNTTLEDATAALDKPEQFKPDFIG